MIRLAGHTSTIVAGTGIFADSGLALRSTGLLQGAGGPVPPCHHSPHSGGDMVSLVMRRELEVPMSEAIVESRSGARDAISS